MTVFCHIVKTFTAIDFASYLCQLILCKYNIMRWFVSFLFIQWIMWSTSENPPGTMEGEPPEAVVQTKEKCEQNKNQLESLKEIMMRNQEVLKKKEEEVQVMYHIFFNYKVTEK